MVGCPSGQEGGVHAGAVGDSTGGATHAQSAWPHANGHNSVNIRAILLIFVVLDSPFKALQNNAIIWFWHGLDT